MIVIIGILLIIYGIVQFFRGLHYLKLSKYSEDIEYAKFLKNINNQLKKGI